MKVYIEPEKHMSRAMLRVTKAFKQYSPSSVEFVADEADADLIVMHVIGYPEIVERVSWCKDQKKRYALLQYCMRSTQRPNTTDWLSLWADAAAVYSYYDLNRLAVEDGTALKPGTNFVCAPLGLDKAFTKLEVFATPRKAVLTSGYMAGPVCEAIEEMASAAVAHGFKVYQLGPKPAGLTTFNGPWDLILGVADSELAQIYGRCAFVSGLRHGEGFEMPALEGLAMGARPIVFDRPDMELWYKDFAVFVPESAGTTLTQDIYRAFSINADPISMTERRFVVDKFKWSNLVDLFWEGIGS